MWELQYGILTRLYVLVTAKMHGLTINPLRTFLFKMGEYLIYMYKLDSGQLCRVYYDFCTSLTEPACVDRWQPGRDAYVS